ncbi:MAG: hypothetical protein CM1200mP34_3890 [Verrucomicrobiales bacterium]|nr:MAG: hypothetical protein CM1200mP34_3890 [Verrucomicrobiales bacterium]
MSGETACCPRSRATTVRAWRCCLAGRWSCGVSARSLPAGLIAGRIKGIDLREVGSGNIGATNAFRILGKGIGTPVLLIDVLKGLLPCLLLPALVAGLFPDAKGPPTETLHF